MKRIWLPICLLLVIGCGITPKDPVEKVAEEVREEAAKPAEEKPVEPLGDPKVNAQNIMVLGQKLMELQQSSARLEAALIKLEFYSTKLSEDPTLQGPYAVAEEAWKAHIAELQARAQENAMIRQQQQQISNLNQRLAALEKNGGPESPVPPEEPPAKPAEEDDAEPEDPK